MMGNGMWTILQKQRGVPNDDSGKLWTRQPGAGVDAIVMAKTGCYGEATMDSAIIAVMEDDGR